MGLLSGYLTSFLSVFCTVLVFTNNGHVISSQADFDFSVIFLFGMPPSYADKDFWDTRFQTEACFEWLGEGDIIVNAVRKILAQQDKTHGSTSGERHLVPKILHIGAGTSKLDNKLLTAREDCTEKDSLLLVNTDFSPQAVMKARERPRPSNSVWEVSDALSWKDVINLGETYGHFTVAVDKSTSDAISCGEDVSIVYQQADLDNQLLHPLYIKLVQSNRDTSIRITPLEMLALHLASIVTPGGAWIVLSYSSNRFPFLSEDEASSKQANGMSITGQLWKVDEVVPVEAPSGQSNGHVHAPAIMHYLYVMRRTDTPCL